MSKLNIQIPNSLYERLQMLARRDGVSLEQFATLAIAEKVSALTTEEYLQARGERGDRDRYDSILAKVPDVAPDSRDIV